MPVYSIQVVPFESSDERGDDRQDISIGIDHVTTKVDEITNFLGKFENNLR